MACAGADLATCMYRIVVSMLTCPASAWMVRGAPSGCATSHPNGIPNQRP